MDIPLFISSLDWNEEYELKQYFLQQEKQKQEEEAKKNSLLTKTDVFIEKYPEISVRLKNVLQTYRYDGVEYYFPFIEHISKKDFLKIRGAGEGTWKEFEKIISNSQIQLED